MKFLLGFTHRCRFTNHLQIKSGRTFLMKLAATWLSHSVSHASESPQRKMPKLQGCKAGFVWPLIWAVIEIPCTHSLTKESEGKNPGFFFLKTSALWVRFKPTNKTNAKKRTEKGGKCGEWRKIAFDVLF